MLQKTGNIKDVLAEITKKVDPVIEEILTLSVDRKNHELVKYQISCGGKRLRPALAILSSRMMGGKEKDVLYPAAALEILHNYTLIVDDIIDHSEFRRGKPTVWKKYGVTMADIISMDYAASVFDLPIRKKNEIYSILSKTLKTITDGQVLDILFEQKGREDEDFVRHNRHSTVALADYNDMVSKKTAALFEVCCEIGGVCANAKEKETKALKSFGFNLGMAFQIQDDILDIFGDEKKFGKKIGKDIIERKLGNIIISLAMEEFNAEDKEDFINILKKDSINDKDVQIGIAMISKTGAQKRAYGMQSNFLKKAQESLYELPQNEWNDILKEIIIYLIERAS